MSKCEHCYHETICPESDFKIDRSMMGKCEYYQKKWDNIDKLIDIISYNIVMLYLQFIQCKHLCITCEYKSTCRDMIKAELDSLKIKEQL